MIDVAVSFLVLLLSVGSTYLFCVRPMRKGRCVMGPMRHSTAPAAKELQGQETTGA